MRRTLVIVLTAAAVGAVAGATAGLVVGQGRTGSNAVLPQAAVLARRAPASAVRGGAALSPETIYRTDSPAVVVIRDTVTQIVPPTFFTPGGKEQVGALGSGFVVDRNGDIVTNDHVVQGAHNIRVGFSGGATYPAKIVGIDPTTDIAVDGPRHPGAERSHDSRCDPDRRPDQPRQLGRAAPRPLRSRRRRQRAARKRYRRRKRRCRLRGPELDRAHRREPADRARRAAHPWLGVEIETIDPSVARVVRGLPEHGVVVLRVVKGSPAANAGLQSASRQVTVGGVTAFTGGDSIVAVNGKPIASSGQLFDVLAPLEPGDHVELRVVRGSAARTVDVTLGNVPG